MDANVSLLNLAPSSLRRAAEIKEQIDDLTAELSRILSGPIARATKTDSSGAAGRRKMSAAGRARIAAAARARWAKIRASKGPIPSPSQKPKRTMSAAAKAKIAAAARARWAKIKAAKAR